MSYEYFEIQKELGKQAEALVLWYLINIKGYRAKKVDHDTHPFDIGVQKGNGKKFKIEVKVYGLPNLPTIFAETVQISPKQRIQSTPEYLTYSDNIEYMMYVDLVNNIAYVYNMKKFAAYVLKNKPSERLINRGTAMGIKIPRCCEDAGFLSKINLKPY